MTKALHPADLIEPNASLSDLRRRIQKCRGCDIWRRATQAVFGEGSRRCEVMLIGEQPGNREDLEGRPFVGPAGRLLDQALLGAGIRRDRVYVTNVVKHFNSTRRGKFRIHKKPNAEQIADCRPWLEAEIRLIKPKVILCLGSTAAHTLIGRRVRISRQRGELAQSPFGPLIAATVHPSFILRSPDSASRRAEMARFVEDLRTIARTLPASALDRVALDRDGSSKTC